MYTTFAMTCLALVLAAPAAAGGMVRLTFAPKDGREIVQRLTTHTVTRVVGDPTRREVVQESLTRVRYERSSKGWRVIATPVSARTTRDGVEIADPMSRGMLGREIVYVLGPEAQVEDITGFEAIVEAIRDSLPAEARAAMASVLDVEVMKQRERHDFEARTTEWAGLEVKDGDEVPYQDVYPLPTGALVLHARVHIGPIEKRAGRQRVTIRTAFESDSAAVGALLRKVMGGLVTLARLDSLEVGGARLVGMSERVVDAATLDILEESSERVIHIPVNLPGRGPAMAVRTERRSYVFEDAPGNR